MQKTAKVVNGEKARFLKSLIIGDNSIQAKSDRSYGNRAVLEIIIWEMTKHVFRRDWLQHQRTTKSL